MDWYEGVITTSTMTATLSKMVWKDSPMNKWKRGKNQGRSLKCAQLERKKLTIVKTVRSRAPMRWGEVRWQSWKWKKRKMSVENGSKKVSKKTKATWQDDFNGEWRQCWQEITARGSCSVRTSQFQLSRFDGCHCCFGWCSCQRSKEEGAARIQTSALPITNGTTSKAAKINQRCWWWRWCTTTLGDTSKSLLDRHTIENSALDSLRVIHRKNCTVDCANNCLAPAQSAQNTELSQCRRTHLIVTVDNLEKVVWRAEKDELKTWMKWMQKWSAGGATWR